MVDYLLFDSLSSVVVALREFVQQVDDDAKGGATAGVYRGLFRT